MPARFHVAQQRRMNSRFSIDPNFNVHKYRLSMSKCSLISALFKSVPIMLKHSAYA